ncbi:MAG: hypothetical protein F7C07_05540 [Desulfurococcales archaeon]|nr:hypothetical protein [Desulfurococcales archaeon]
MKRIISLLIVVLILAPMTPASAVSAGSQLAPPPKISFNQSPPLVLQSPSEGSGGSPATYWSWQDYVFKVPDVEPTVVSVFVNEEFASSGFKPVYRIVDVPEGEWQLILIRIDGLIYDPEFGRPVQYDRPLWVFIDGVPVVWGSTAQRFNWTVMGDITMFYPLFEDGLINVSMILPNWVVPQIGVTGRFLVNLTIYLYPGEKPEEVPDDVIPLWMDTWKQGLAVSQLTRTDPNVSSTISVPLNTYKARLVLFTEGLAYDEFWYYYGAGYREVKIYFDDTLAALIHPYHYIYTGGLMPFLWRPIPAVKTYLTEPVMIDLTGLLPLIVGERNVTMEVTNIFATSRWIMGGALLVWLAEGNVSFTLLEYETSYDSFNSTKEEEGYTEYRAGSSFNLTASSEITVNGEKVVATTTLVSILEVARKFNDIWDNATVNMYRASATDIYSGNVKVYSWSNSWDAPLSVKYGLEITVEGDISQATVDNPVPGEFSIEIHLSQGLSSMTVIETRDDKRVIESKESVEAFNVVAGTLIFISPTGAVITGITQVSATTFKQAKGLDLALGPDGLSLWMYTRNTRALTTLYSLYNIVYDSISMVDI